jgi:hypothetical protein
MKFPSHPDTRKWFDAVSNIHTNWLKKSRCTGFQRNLEYPMNQLRSVNLIDFWGEIWHPGDRKEKKGLEMLPRVFIGKKKWAHVAIFRQ